MLRLPFHSKGKPEHRLHLVNHGAEIAYVYGDVPNPDPAEQQFAKTVMDYWISFTVSLDPNDNKGQSRE